MSYCPTYNNYTVTDYAGAVEPLTTAEAKEHLRVDHSSEDDYIDALVAAARKEAEDYTGMLIKKRTVVEYHHSFPMVLQLRWPYVQSITSIQYIDTDGATQTLSSSLYKADIIGSTANIEPAYGQNWPVTRDESNAVIITYVSGYDATTDMPETIIQAIRLMIAKWYEVREENDGRLKIRSLPTSAEALLNQYRIWAL